MFWRHFWIKDAKKSKLEVISRFDLQTMFCGEHEHLRFKWSDSCGIRNLTSIHFCKSKARKIKKKEEHGNHNLQSQISQSASVDLWPFRLEYPELQSSFDANSIVLDSWINDLSMYHISAKKQYHMREKWFF
jgi:hypothetical protein